ncbi:MAG: hypothetical protein JSV78_11645 [Phycisphaerales bacterium]|nr:MAG: hypothetical protein JSV78_11645 [Phycisphaerales bacterium]
MCRKLGLVAGICGLMLLMGACRQSERSGDTVATERGGEPAARSESGYTIGWQQIRGGMDPVEVLSLLNEPHRIKVTKVSTYWYYSNRGADGPVVVFDTRNMRVERWRSPGSD